MKHSFAFSTLALLVALVLAGFTGTDALAPDPPETTASVAAWSVDQVHSNVGFKVRHLGISNVTGTFHDYDVDLAFDPADLNTLEATATIQVASIDTENQKRDDHLRSPDFFAAEEYPTMTFISKEVRNIDGNAFELVGDLTIRGVTKEVVLDSELIGTAMMRGTEKAALEARTRINRKDFGLEWDQLTEAGNVIVADEVDIILEIEADKQTPDVQGD